MRTALLVIFLFGAAAAQELNIAVNVNYSSISSSTAPVYISSFSVSVQDYLNNTVFTNIDWKGNKIEGTMDIFLMNQVDDNTYKARAVINTRRPIYNTDNYTQMLSIVDEEWIFQYLQDQDYNNATSEFDPLISFLEFYALLIIGYHTDSWERFGGTEYYNEARMLAVKGAANKYFSGWQPGSSNIGYNRAAFLNNLIDENYRGIREAFYNYHYGLDVYAKDPELGRKYIIDFINTIEGMSGISGKENILLKVFFDSKYREIVDLLKDYPDTTVFDSLIIIDPRHMEDYRSVMEK